MQFAIAFGKVLVLAVWFWGVSSFVAPVQVPAAEIGRLVLLGLLAVHVGEAIGFSKTLAAEEGGNRQAHVLRLLVFGYLHVLDTRYG